jgi:hypothetical protein
MKILRNFFAAILLIAVASTVLTAAAIDSSAVFNPIDFAGQVFDKWREPVIFYGGIFAALLPLVQLILKRIPTERSIKIQGYLGKMLDILTWFQKDVIKPTAMFLALFLSLSLINGCGLIRTIKSDCKITNTQFTYDRQNVCIECLHLPMDISKTLNKSIILKLKNTPAVQF